MNKIIHNISDKNMNKIIRHISENRGQFKITIPKIIATIMGLKNKDEVELSYNNNTIIIKVIK